MNHISFKIGQLKSVTLSMLPLHGEKSNLINNKIFTLNAWFLELQYKVVWFTFPCGHKQNCIFLQYILSR